MFKKNLIFLIFTALLFPAFLAAEPAIDVKSYKLSPLKGNIMTTHDTQTAPLWDLYFGALLGYSHKPLVMEGNGLDRDLVGSRLDFDLFGSIGFGKWFDFGLTLPIVMYQGGEGYFNEDLKHFGVGDLTIYPRVHLWGLDNKLFDIALILQTSFPTGQAVDKFMGDSNVTFTPTLALSTRFWIFRAALNFYYMIREEQKIGNLVIDDELGIKLAAAATVHKDVDVMADFVMRSRAANYFQQLNESPITLNLGAKGYLLNRDLEVGGGAGFGLTEGFGNPVFHVFGQVTYHMSFAKKKKPEPKPQPKPEPKPQPKPKPVPSTDKDKDGIADKDDNCPAVANKDQADFDKDKKGDVCDEDFDGDGTVNEKDNCPKIANKDQGDVDKDGKGDVCDDDADGDKIPNDKDKCKLEAENINQFEDEDGCPDIKPQKKEMKHIEIKKNKIVVKSKIFFALNSDRINKKSYSTLDEVYEILKSNPEIDMIIEGHTDKIGNHDKNVLLSQKRAESVMNYLIKKGIKKERLTAKGYGPDKPLSEGNTKKDQEMNRRVEFKVIFKNSQK